MSKSHNTLAHSDYVHFQKNKCDLHFIGRRDSLHSGKTWKHFGPKYDKGSGQKCQTISRGKSFNQMCLKLFK